MPKVNSGVFSTGATGAMAPVILRKRLIAPAVSNRNGKFLLTLGTRNIKILNTLLIWSYKSNHIRSKSHEDRKVFCTRIFLILHLLILYKETFYPAFRLEHVQVRLGLRM